MIARPKYFEKMTHPKETRSVQIKEKFAFRFHD